MSYRVLLPISRVFNRTSEYRIANEDILVDEEVTQVARVCGGMPLLTHLVADSLAHGRLSLDVSITECPHSLLCRFLD